MPRHGVPLSVFMAASPRFTVLGDGSRLSGSVESGGRGGHAGRVPGEIRTKLWIVKPRLVAPVTLVERSPIEELAGHTESEAPAHRQQEVGPHPLQHVIGPCAV